MATVIGIALVGYGCWGPRLARAFAIEPRARLVAVCDIRPARLAAAAADHPGVHLCERLDALWRLPGVDAIVVATPASTHAAVVTQCLIAGRHVLVEKPMTTSLVEAQRLVELAERRQRVLMVDHTYLHAPAFAAMRSLVEDGAIGALRSYEAARTNVGSVCADASVLWDLAVHDLAILDGLCGASLRHVAAHAVSPVAGPPLGVAHLTLTFANGLLAHLHASWWSPEKTRRITLAGERGMLLWDDLEDGARLRRFDRRLQGEPRRLRERLPITDGGTTLVPLAATEPLRAVAADLVAAIGDGRPPATDGVAGCRVVAWLEAAERSLLAGGESVAFDEQLAVVRAH